MAAPVTAQRTNAPGRTTRKSPSRYLTSASPGIGLERSVRLSKQRLLGGSTVAGSRQDPNFTQHNHSVAATKPSDLRSGKLRQSRTSWYGAPPNVVGACQTPCILTLAIMGFRKFLIVLA